MACNNGTCETYPEKRDLDGVYFRVERDGKWKNICFSDMTELERGKIVSGKSIPWLISLVNRIADALHDVGDAFDIYGE